MAGLYVLGASTGGLGGGIYSVGIFRIEGPIDESIHAPVIADNADVLTDEQEARLLAAMQKISYYCKPVLYTTDKDYDSLGYELRVKSRELLDGHPGVILGFSREDGRVRVYPSAMAGTVINKDVMDEIVKRISGMAKGGDYAGAAEEAFGTVYSRFTGGWR